ncbi:hypothetical protein M405DRAFT_808251, partial [Rhizopogon salebrosus TDB-379]
MGCEPRYRAHSDGGLVCHPTTKFYLAQTFLLRCTLYGLFLMPISQSLATVLGVSSEEFRTLFVPARS